MAHRVESEIIVPLSSELPVWNNFTSNSFFVTLNTASKKSYFGRIRRKKFVFASMGIIAEDELIKTDKLLDRVTVDEYLILPYQIHAIISIDRINPFNRFPGINSLSSGRISRKTKVLQVMENYRNTVSMRCLEAGFDKFTWNKYYYCHPITDKKSHLNICRYFREKRIKGYY